MDYIEKDGTRYYNLRPRTHDGSSIGQLYLVIALVAIIAVLMFLGLHIIS